MNQIADLITQKSDPEDVFQLLDMLGQGSYGSVSKALHKQTGELYAVKILPATSGVEIASIKKQIGILKQCDDDHIVRYYGSYFKDNNLWIVMEYCIAGSVTDIMQITKKKLNQNQIASILESALKGLQYLHDRKKIHRDIKAANILLDQKGNAKLADFGVSASAMHTNARFRTHIGSPYWMSPQIIKYSQYDFKTDIWSLGITAIELAQGQVPNSHVKPFMAIFQIKSNPVQSFKQPSKWSPQFNDFVRQCLQVNPTNRPQAKQLLEHAFIKNYSKGQRLLAQLVLSSMQQIQQFRMTQSRNSSFAQIIVDEARDSEQTKTLVQNSQNGTVKQSKSQIQKSINDQLQGSMIILDSHRSQTNSCTGSVVINDNVIENRKQNKQNNALSNYINGMKQMYNAEVQCAEMLINTINKYDQQLTEAINKLFEEFKNKVQNDLKCVKELKQKNPNLHFDEEYTSKLIKCQNIVQFICPKQKIIVHHQYIDGTKQDLQIDSKNDIQDQITIALRQKSIPQTAQKSHNDSKFNLESTQDRQHYQVNIHKKYQERGPIKSFNKYENNNFILSQSETDKYNKQFFNATNDRSPDNFCQPVRYGQSQGDILRNNNQNRNSSRIMMRMVDQFEVPDGDKFQKHEQLKIMTKDPDIVDYLKSKQEFKFSQSGIQPVNHTKSHFYPTYTCSKFASTNEGVFRQQRSTEQSISKSKNKSVKNLKAKKKTRVAS